MIRSRTHNQLVQTILVAAAFVAFAIGLCISAPAAHAASVSEIAPGDHLYMGKENAPGYTGLPYWRVLDKDSQGNLLLMSEYLWLGDGRKADEHIQFNPGPVPDWSVRPYLEGYEELGYKEGGSSWQGSNAQAWCKAFEKAVLSHVSGLTIKPTTKSDGEFPSDNPSVTYAKKTNILNNDTVFLLSAEEVAHYMPARSDRVALPYGWDVDSPKDPPSWWLRSPRLYNTSECAGQVLALGNYKGMLDRSPCFNLGAMRPAMWVNLAANTPAAKCGKAGKAIWNIGSTQARHIYGAPTYTWSSNNSSCTAKVACTNCGHTISETVQAISSTSGAITSYVAVFKNTTYFTTQTKRVGRTPVTTKTALKTATAKNQTYTGKALKPAVTVKDAKGNTVPASAYTVSYTNNIKVGTATATVIAKKDSKYTGTVKATFKITKPAPASVKDMPVYWMYNKNTGENLYTAALPEKNALSKKPQWQFKKTVWYAPTTGEPVYRLVNKVTNDHHWTKSKTEANTLVKRGKWKMDFGGKPAFYSGGSKTVWRLRHDARIAQQKAGTHRFATSASEINTLKKSKWVKESETLKATRYK